jgi:hypothetical protein
VQVHYLPPRQSLAHTPLFLLPIHKVWNRPGEYKWRLATGTDAVGSPIARSGVNVDAAAVMADVDDLVANYHLLEALSA